jgi:cbb3-type cytochrome oxidase maturation protein
MDILYLLIPLSAVLVLIIIAVFGWALHSGQFDDLASEGERILRSEAESFSSVPEQASCGVMSGHDRKTLSLSLDQDQTDARIPL